MLDGTASIEPPSWSSFRYREIELVFSFVTTSPQGSIFWLGGEKDFVFAGIRQGFAVAAFNLGGGKATLRSSVRVNDGNRHSVAFRLQDNHGQLFVDGLRVQAVAASSKFVQLDGFEGPTIGRPLPLLSESQGFFQGELHEMWLNGDDLLARALNSSGLVGSRYGMHA